MVNYATKEFEKEHMARAMGTNLPISFKQSIVVCDFIRGKTVTVAKELLKKVIDKKMVIPFRRFNSDRGHKRGNIAAGRYPIKVSNEFVKLLEGVEANAQFKGLNTSNLIIKHLCAQQSSKAWHYGRKRRRQMKRTNIEIIVQEKAKKQAPAKKETPVKKAAEPKKEAVKEIKKEPEKPKEASPNIKK